jgi:hypothetical protein
MVAESSKIWLALQAESAYIFKAENGGSECIILWERILSNTSLYNLKQVDYSERGQRVEIIVDGVPKPQMVVFSGTDCFGEKYYFTEQGLKYIQDSRLKRSWQNLVPNYLAKIPVILRFPELVARNIDRPDHYLFCDRVAIREYGNRKCLLGVLLIKSNINVVWNFYWLQENKPPKATEIIYKSKGYKKR